MLDDDSTESTSQTTDEAKTPVRRRAAGRPAGPPPAAVSFSAAAADAAPAAAEKPARRTTEKVATEAADAVADEPRADEAGPDHAGDEKPARKSARAAKVAAEVPAEPAPAPAAAAMFQAPPEGLAPAKPQQRDDDADTDDDDDDDHDGDGAPKRRRRSRGGRRRRKGDGEQDGGSDGSRDQQNDSEDDASSEDGGSEGGGSRRRRRRARAGEGGGASSDDPDNTVVKVRQGRSPEDEITGVTGSTRLEAKKQRRREGREAGRRRAPIVSEAEFLARREAVTREMVVRQRDDYTQIAVLEDKVLVEHYVARESQTSQIGNVYLGKVQNVLPSMEAAFVDIGAGRNAVLYAGEVDWSTLGNGKSRKIEEALTPGQVILVQVTKDPIGQKGARLTSQVSLPGRFLVLVPGGQTSGISRKLPENERTRLKALLKEVLPEHTGVIVRTAAEGASEDQLTRDVSGLTARWTDIESKIAAGNAPQLLYSEPDLMIKVVRDLFNEDFAGLVVEGADAWDMIKGYVDHVAPDLADRVTRWEDEDHDAFSSYRVDEQIHKALDRKVFLPSGGSLVIDRTEAMTVVDVNTGKYTGSGGNLEETVTRNNLEAAEEVVRQLRLRDIGGIIVVDFIDMVLESNRDLVLRRLVECLGRDRTRHQVAEVTSLGLVQMTRKRIGTGLLESFSADCDHCKGRGVVIADAPVEPKKDDGPRRGGRGGRGRSGGNGGNGGANQRGGHGGSDSSEQQHRPEPPKPEAPKTEAQPDSVQDPAKDPAENTAEAPQQKAESPKVLPPREPEKAPTQDTQPLAPTAQQPQDEPAVPAAKKAPARRRAASKPAGPPPPVLTDEGQAP
jgi:ribonuclease E